MVVVVHSPSDESRDIQQMMTGFETDWFKMSAQFHQKMAKELHEKLQKYETNMATLQEDQKYTHQVAISDLEHINGDSTERIAQ